MKTFTDFRKTSQQLASMTNEGETNKFPAEKSMPADLQDPSEMDEDEVVEDAPANNAGGGNIAGIGVGPQGEPGVTPRKLKIVGPPPVDPRLFRDAIFSHRPPNVVESQKTPATMSAAEINKHLDRHEALSSKLTNDMIAAGRGYERPSEYLHPSKTDPLSKALQDQYHAHQELKNEVRKRYGPNPPRRLPRGFGPVKVI